MSLSDLSIPVLIISVIIGLLINCIPLIIAFVKSNSNKMQVAFFNLVIPYGLSLILAIMTALLSASALTLIASAIISIISLISWIIALIKAIKGY